MTAKSSSRRPWLIALILAVIAALVAVLFVLPAERGWDPTGVGEMTGLTKIAEPENAELERGMARMENEEVLVLIDQRPEPIEGVQDVWEYELAPFESIEFKYTIPEGEPIAFRWEGTAPLDYDMHAHPFEGGVELTESYGIGEAQVMQGRYIPPFTGIHGWFWENRSMDNVIIRLEASGAMTHSAIFQGGAEGDRPLEGAEGGPEGAAAGHEMQNAE